MRGLSLRIKAYQRDYYMTSSASGQDGPNRALWLVTRWSHLARSGLPAVSRKKNVPESHTINPLLTKFVRSRWLDISLVLFIVASLWTSSDFVSVHKHAKKKELGQYPAILTSHLVNNPYLLNLSSFILYWYRLHEISAFIIWLGSVSGQDEPNRALWLATREGKMELSCPLGTTHRVPINPLLTKLFQSRWLNIGVVLFLQVYRPRLRLGQ